MCVAESFYCTAEVGTRLLINYTVIKKLSTLKQKISTALSTCMPENFVQAQVTSGLSGCHSGSSAHWALGESWSPLWLLWPPRSHVLFSLPTHSCPAHSPAFSSPALLTYFSQEMSPRSQWFQSCKTECVLSKDVQAFDMSLGIAVKAVMTSIRNYPLKLDRTSFRKSGKSISINRQWKKPFNVFGTKGWKKKTI